VKADFALIEHVIINLLENAVKYAPEGSGISISVHEADKALHVHVADNAPVIPPYDRKRVFDKFYRLHSAQHISGTGLGLSICKGIIEAHGGRIWVDAPTGEGNQFTFSLPVPEESPDRARIEGGINNA
jgi:two-component system sensor histidine kinase KdpD